MFLHLGADTIIPLKNVILIADCKEGSSNINSEFLHTMHEEALIYDVSGGKPKSFVIADEKVYLSAISSLTLKKRADSAFDDVDED